MMTCRRPMDMLVSAIVALAVIIMPALTLPADAAGSDPATIDYQAIDYQAIDYQAIDYQVIGGAPTEAGRWPSTVAIVRADEPDATVGQLCAGTVIAADLVLTAAHCFHTVDGVLSRQATEVRVVAGRTNLSAEGGVEVQGAEVYVDPGFEAGTQRHDIAVLRLDGDLLVDGLAVPVQRLADPGAATPAGGTVAVIVGWGRTGAGPGVASSDTAELVEAHVPIWGDRACRAAFDGTVDLALSICAGGRGEEGDPQPDACNGDSGGPLLLPVQDEDPIQLGVTSYGPEVCGEQEPGIYASVAPARDFIDGVISGAVQPTLPSEATTVLQDAVRVSSNDPATTPIDQAVAASQAAFADGLAEIAVVARSDAFPDGLAGSSLVHGRGPLLFTPPDTTLAEPTRSELLRVLRPDSTVYLLGGPAAVPATVEEAIREDGFVPVRLSGATREATAAAIGREVIARHGVGNRPPFGTVILATSAFWPDAVLAGQLSVFWGYPVILTPPDRLHPAAAAALAAWDIDRLLVVGGPAAVSEAVAREATEVADAATTQRLAGGTRVETGMQVALFHRGELARFNEPAPGTSVVVNVRREDGYAHILSATPLLGATAGVFIPVEGDAGDLLPEFVAVQICGFGGRPIGIGGPDVLAEEVITSVATALAQSAC